MLYRVRKPLVAGEERRVRRVGERDTSRVASGQIAAQLPHARRQELVGIGVKGERGEVVECFAGTIGGDLACRGPIEAADPKIVTRKTLAPAEPIRRRSLDRSDGAGRRPLKYILIFLCRAVSSSLSRFRSFY